jgi:Ca2+-binding RTX toxin-like protein
MVKARALFISIATAALMVAPAFANGITSSVAGARTECTIVGTAADDTLAGTTRDDVICGKAGSDSVDALEGNDVVRGGQGDDGTGCSRVPGPIVRGCFSGSILRGVVTRGSFITFGLNGGDGSDVVKGQQDDDSIEGNDQNDKLYGGQGDDCLGVQCTATDIENGNDFLKTRDHVSGNDYANGGTNTNTCRIDAGDQAVNCQL